MKWNLFIAVILIFSLSCSKYTLEEGSNNKIDVYLKFYKNSNGVVLDIDYPVVVYCVDEKSLFYSEFHFVENEKIALSLDEGEYSVNSFIGMDDDNYILMNDISGHPLISMKENGVADSPLMSVHTNITLDKKMDINLTPAYIVSSVEFELDNIPDDVRNIHIEITPISSGYEISGGYSARVQNSVIECSKKNEKWVSGQKFLFPSEGQKTTVSINLDYGDVIKKYSYTLSDGFKQGQPYKFTGGYNDDNLDLDGKFQMSGWNEEEKVFIDFDNDTSSSEDDSESGSSTDKVYYVDKFPLENTIWESFYVWKLIEQNATEATVTLISPDQWFKTFKDGEAIKLLEEYEFDGIKGWNTFSRVEAEAFYTEFSKNLGVLNAFLEENGHNVFYTENRYLCDNGEYAFNMTGSMNIRPAGYTVKYYLRPIISLQLRIKDN